VPASPAQERTFDPEKPTITSGSGWHTAVTTCGRPAECRQLGQMIVRVLDGLAANDNGAVSRPAQGRGSCAGGSRSIKA
jgi:hypothetical protein